MGIRASIRSLLNAIGLRKPADRFAESAAPSASPIVVFDDYGRELHIDRETWRKEVLPDQLRNSWNDAERLQHAIQMGLADGFAAEVLAGARRLVDLRPDVPDAIRLLASALRGTEQPHKAVAALKKGLFRFPSDPLLLCQLGAQLIELGQRTDGEASLRSSLQADPNGEVALKLLMTQANERQVGAGYGVCREFAALPNSWFPQLWLAREALESKDLRHAVTLYEIAIANAGVPVPESLLWMLTGDLGLNGYVREVVSLGLPRFDVEHHGIAVGHNLIHALVELGQWDDARAVLAALHARKRHDWTTPLTDLESHIATRKLESASIDESSEPGLGIIDGPVWLPIEAQRSLGILKPPDEVSVLTICPSSSPAQRSEEVVLQLATPLGSFARSLALLISEQIFFGTKAVARAGIPWIQSPSRSGFALYGSVISDHDALVLAGKVPSRPSYIIVGHIGESSAGWTIEARLLDVAGSRRVAEFHREFDPSVPDPAPVMSLVQDIRYVLIDKCGVSRTPLASLYDPPSDHRVINYMQALEQTSLVRCLSSEPPESAEDFVNRRATIRVLLQAVLDNPASATLRALFAQALVYMCKIDPQLPLEFRDQVLKLLREHPTPSEVRPIVAQCLARVFPDDAEVAARL